VTTSKDTTPILDSCYTRYLQTEKSASFVQTVTRCYTISTLERLALCGSCVSRRAAVLALSYVADYRSNGVVGRALCDSDRAVRLLAENGIRQLWCRYGTTTQEQQLRSIMRLNECQQFQQVIDEADQLIEENPGFAEVWNQRAIAYFYLGMYDESANDCQQTLDLNSYQFGAAIGMAHCYLELDDPVGALQYFRRAIDINPSMEGVRAQIEFLERSLEER
jgi:tetratricopeptide (TPR) repeat protein